MRRALRQPNLDRMVVANKRPVMCKPQTPPRGLASNPVPFKYWDELMLRVMLDPDGDDFD